LWHDNKSLHYPWLWLYFTWILYKVTPLYILFGASKMQAPLDGLVCNISHCALCCSWRWAKRLVFFVWYLQNHFHWHNNEILHNLQEGLNFAWFEPNYQLYLTLSDSFKYIAWYKQDACPSWWVPSIIFFSALKNMAYFGPIKLVVSFYTNKIILFDTEKANDCSVHFAGT
jgi:hypothetical protein